MCLQGLRRLWLSGHVHDWTSPFSSFMVSPLVGLKETLYRTAGDLNDLTIHCRRKEVRTTHAVSCYLTIGTCSPMPWVCSTSFSSSNGVAIDKTYSFFLTCLLTAEVVLVLPLSWCIQRGYRRVPLAAGKVDNPPARYARSPNTYV